MYQFFRYEADSVSGGKWWTVEQSNDMVTTAWGRVGSDGQSREKVYASVGVATGAVTNMCRQKEKRGYKRISHTMMAADRMVVAVGEEDTPIESTPFGVASSDAKPGQTLSVLVSCSGTARMMQAEAPIAMGELVSATTVRTCVPANPHPAPTEPEESEPVLDEPVVGEPQRFTMDLESVDPTPAPEPVDQDKWVPPEKRKVEPRVKRIGPYERVKGPLVKIEFVGGGTFITDKLGDARRYATVNGFTSITIRRDQNTQQFMVTMCLPDAPPYDALMCMDEPGWCSSQSSLADRMEAELHRLMASAKAHYDNLRGPKRVSMGGRFA